MLIFSLLVVGTFWHIVVTVCLSCRLYSAAWVSVYAISPVFSYVLLWSVCAPCFPCIKCFLLVLIFLLWHLFRFPFVSLSHLVSAISSSQAVSTCLLIFSVYKASVSVHPSLVWGGLFLSLPCESCICILFYSLLHTPKWQSFLGLFEGISHSTYCPSDPVFFELFTCNRFYILTAGKNKIKDKDNE